MLLVHAMSFLSALRPRIKTVQKKEVTETVWEKCPKCSQLIYDADLPQHLFCCTHCGHHLRWPLNQRLTALWDDGQAIPIAVPEVADDPLKFRDKKKYADRLRDARGSTLRRDAFVAAHGTVHGQPLAVIALDFDFMTGSMGRAVGEAIIASAQYAMQHRLPLLAITASGGARMQESTLSLLQMARTTAAVVELKQAGLPYLCLLTDPTTGGVTASFAMQGDIIFAEPGALIGFAGPRVIEQTIRQTLPEGFQTAEYLLAHGMVDAVVTRAHLREELGKILRTFNKAA
jgi:acetyl-CoA carboxylase carboxyl transferase subunit beta